MTDDKNYFFIPLIRPAQAMQQNWPLVRVSCCLAQAADESAWGGRLVANYNFWGMKSMPWIPGFVRAMTHEIVNGKPVAVVQNFAAFTSMTEAFDAYGRLISHSDYYKSARESTRLEDYVRKLSAHWSSNPRYADTILALISKYNLTQYEGDPNAPSQTV